MAVRLMVEVMDHWQDWDLTAGERGDLLVIAENANDRSRETYGPIHEPYVLKRAGKAAAGWRNAIGKLMKKGVLKYAVRDGRELSGFPGQHAVYQLVVLCPEPPHDGLHGQCTRPAERITSQVTQYEGTEGTGHPTGDPMRGTGHLRGAERVTSQVTPTPLNPSGTNPPPLVVDVPVPRTEAPGEGEGGEGGEQRSNAFTTLAAIVAREPRLTLGTSEIEECEELVALWLERSSAQHLEVALTRGLPAEVTHPLGLVRKRLRGKLPPAPAPAAPKDTGSVCAECRHVRPVAVEFNGAPYCSACTEVCVKCDAVLPEAVTLDGLCGPCREL
ncbi:hypothetical protein [Streptomyces sp. Da 82-17]|uniref:hypothetical protein n=1 Tax=Streptomyces sp. Da 82-17 TaxID=3377116 RepID=UPI0038D43E3D